MIDVNELRRGVTFTLDGDLFRVLEYHHHKPGRGKATIRVQVRNLRTGATREMTFNSGDRVEDIRLEARMVEYMDISTFEQPQLRTEIFGDDVLYLKEGLQLKLSFYEGEVIDYELPTTVDQEVVEADVVVAGDTATGVTKSVTTETGLKVTVPQFVETGDVIRVDTRTGEYVTRI